LTFKSVRFTYADVLHTAKMRFRSMKVTIGRSTDDAKAHKKDVSNAKNKRLQRKKHRRDDRSKAVKFYKETYQVDPSPFLDECDWMS